MSDNPATPARAEFQVPPEDWTTGGIEQFLESNHGLKPGPFGSSITKATYKSKGYRVYGQEQVIAGNLSIGDYYISESKFNELRSFAVEENDVLLSLVGTAGRVLVVQRPFEPGIINPRLMRLRPSLSKTHPQFLKHLLTSDIVRRQLERLAQGGTMAVLNSSTLRSLVLSRPERTEQEAVVKVIHALDTVLVASESLIAKLKALKAGLLHDLLTKGIDENGELRDPVAHPEQFKESPLGWIPKDWTIKPVGQLFEMRLGKMLSKASKTGRHPRPYVANRHVQWDYVDTRDLDWMDFYPKESEKYSLEPDDILICEGGEVGRTALWRGELNECYFQKAIHRLRPRNGDIVPSFMLGYMRIAAMNGFLTNYTIQTSIAHLTGEKLELLPVTLPPEDEQHRIAALLAQHDSRIRIEDKYLAKLKLIKKGLMEDLLTGQVRVQGDGEGLPCPD